MTEQEVQTRLTALNQKLEHVTNIATDIASHAARLSGNPVIPIPNEPVSPVGAPIEELFTNIDRKIIALQGSLQNSLGLLIPLT